MNFIINCQILPNSTKRRQNSLQALPSARSGFGSAKNADGRLIEKIRPSKSAKTAKQDQKNQCGNARIGPVYGKTPFSGAISAGDFSCSGFSTIAADFPPSSGHKALASFMGSGYIPLTSPDRLRRTASQTPVVTTREFIPRFMG